MIKSKAAMYKVYRQLLFLAGISFFMSALGCKEEVGKNVQSTMAYYDLKGLLDRQVTLLDSLKPKSEKLTVIDGDKETKNLSFDSSEWKKELEIFYKVDINAPILKDAYSQKENKIEDSLKVISYEALEPKNTKIESLKVFYKPNSNTPTFITAIFKEKNALYNSKRNLKLIFNNDYTPSVLSGYEIVGQQKMLMKDTVFYKIVLKNTF